MADLMLRSDIDRRQFVAELALSVLGSWYVNYEAFQSHKNAGMRRHALHSKCRGLVCHDRTIIKAEALING